jgi:hypothetical protein
VVAMTEDKRLLLAQWANNAAITKKYLKIFMSSLIVTQLLFTVMLIML